MSILNLFITMIWLMLPAYMPNSAAAIIVAKTGQGKPIDFGKTFLGKRILGDGKTYKGFLFGIATGFIIAIIQNNINVNLFYGKLPYFNAPAILCLPIGSLLGDMVASFFKRQLGLKKGQAFPLVDQLDFVVGALLLTYLVTPAWFIQNFTLPIIITALIATPLLHLLTNVIGYKLGISKEPW